MKRRWFTMIEIILVLLILSILFLSFKQLFQIKNKDVVYGQTCIENLYGKINNFAKSAIRSQSIYSWSVAYYPDTYKVEIIPSQNAIALSYIISWTTHIHQTYQLTGNVPTQRYCETNEYIIQLSGNDEVLSINKWLGENNQLQSFWLSGSQHFGTSIDIFLYTNNNPTGKHIGTFIIDTRTQAIQKKLCLNIATWGNCLEWDK